MAEEGTELALQHPLIFATPILLSFLRKSFPAIKVEVLRNKGIDNFFSVLEQKEEGKIQGQLNNSDSSQYIRELKDQIAELNHEVSKKVSALLHCKVSLLHLGKNQFLLILGNYCNRFYLSPSVSIGDSFQLQLQTVLNFNYKPF